MKDKERDLYELLTTVLRNHNDQLKKEIKDLEEERDFYISMVKQIMDSGDVDIAVRVV